MNGVRLLVVFSITLVNLSALSSQGVEYYQELNTALQQSQYDAFCALMNDQTYSVTDQQVDELFVCFVKCRCFSLLQQMSGSQEDNSRYSERALMAGDPSYIEEQDPALHVGNVLQAFINRNVNSRIDGCDKELAGFALQIRLCGFCQPYKAYLQRLGATQRSQDSVSTNSSLVTK